MDEQYHVPILHFIFLNDYSFSNHRGSLLISNNFHSCGGIVEILQTHINTDGNCRNHMHVIVHLILCFFPLGYIYIYIHNVFIPSWMDFFLYISHCVTDYQSDDEVLTKKM